MIERTRKSLPLPIHLFYPLYKQLWIWPNMVYYTLSPLCIPCVFMYYSLIYIAWHIVMSKINDNIFSHFVIHQQVRVILISLYNLKLSMRFTNHNQNIFQLFFCHTSHPWDFESLWHSPLYMYSVLYICMILETVNLNSTGLSPTCRNNI